MADSIPREFAEQGAGTPEEAADYLWDVLGYKAIQVMDDRARQAGQDGRTGEQAFYEEARDILIDRYGDDED